MKIEVLLTVNGRELSFSFKDGMASYGGRWARVVEPIEVWKRKFPQYVEWDGTIAFPKEFEPEIILTP